MATRGMSRRIGPKVAETASRARPKSCRQPAKGWKQVATDACSPPERLRLNYRAEEKGSQQIESRGFLTMLRILREESGRGELLQMAGALSVAVGVIHLLVSPEHLAEWVGYGFFFMVAGIAQLAYGLALLLLPWLSDDSDAFVRGTMRGVRKIYLGGVAVNLAIVALWIVTRTVGIPLGPQAGSVEPLDALSLVATIVELALVAMLSLLAQHSAAQAPGQV